MSDKIRQAQATSLVDGAALTLIANCFIGLTTAGILWLESPGRDVGTWIAVLLLVNGLRLAFAARARREALALREPERTFRTMTGGAFIGGSLWAMVPFLGNGISGDGGNAFLIFILGGISAGAIIQSPTYFRAAVAFMVPALLSSILALLLAGSMVSVIVAVNVVLLMVMMIRASISSERHFIASQVDRIEAHALARSLALANSEIRQSNTRLEVLATVDPLTGLGNRAAFNRELPRAIAAARANGAAVVLLVCDLDRFKSINDTLGHTAGDTVLVAFARRLSGLAGPDDLVARLGGDEFCVVLKGEDAARRASGIGDAILKAAGEPIDLGDRPVTIGCSVGLAHMPDHATQPDALFACADIALYAAKDQGRRRLCVFNPEIRRRLERQKQIELAFAAALEDGRIAVHFQPQFTLASKAIVGFEALIRWSDPDIGPVSPQEIVRTAEMLYMSEHLTRHVAKQAAAFSLRLPEMGLPEACVAINVSPSEITTYSLSALLAEVVAACGANPERIEVEITEEALLDTETAGAELAALQAAGFRIVIDDFGVGHSSLAYLMTLPVARLKIDRSFVADIARNRKNQALIAALVGMGQALSIEVVVEGVETEGQSDALRMLGCRTAQGYLLARAMPAEAIEAWLAKTPDRRAALS
ncbi:EAL domain-containing protein [Breoghania sp. L-A4]|uniref:putative bifunctional diguanylate cyclase/phosphodiesterase n=1 Tax=Breoghania sp. L-A4 TaxID=2304600 RepID=UPI0013C2D244|nr:EAL domain-containing protein [Breoghania sp. L-A4]